MRFGYGLKAAMIVALVVLFDRLFPDDPAGITIGLFALGWLIAVVAARPDVRRSRLARGAAAAAALFTLALLDEPGPLAWLLFWVTLSMAALMPKVAWFDDAWRWGWRIALHGASIVVVPLRDLMLLTRSRRQARTTLGGYATMLALPLVGGTLFLALFASANPLIAAALSGVTLPPVWKMIAWAVVAATVWPSLRPHPAVLRLAAQVPGAEPRLPGTTLASVLIALAVFNLLFAVQNALDIVFLWSGAPLPDGMTPAGYAHRGAYPLIVTALLAGALALAMLRPGSESARHPWARRLVALWVVQNLVLVASSALRTIDYVEASMLTAWRIAALAWMALVALGLVLIAWRILRGRSARWLINGNALAGAIVLGVCAFVDLGAVAAAWNVRHGEPGRVDLCYLQQVGDGALLPLIALERRSMTPAMHVRVQDMRREMMDRLAARQANWAEWTPRGARRLAAAKAAAAGLVPLPRHRGWYRCDGALIVNPA